MKTEDRGLRMEDGREAKGPCAAPTELGEQLCLTQGDARGLACPGLRYGGPSGLRRRRGHRPNACIHNGDLREHGRNAVRAQTRLLMHDGQWELEGECLVPKLQGLGTGRGREMRINPHWPAFVRV